jgi:hypothetical protein
MTLPPQFQFSQSSLQDYIDCPRRFELRYLLKVRWPAPITEPVIEFERHIELGVLFHQMVQQYLNDIPLDKIQATALDLDLQTWWNNFINNAPTAPYPGNKYPEYRLSMPFAGFRLVAQYDLIIIDATGNTVIFDWKTSRSHPRKNDVLAKAQSLIYPLLLVESGLRSTPIAPEQIRMIYWYPNFPTRPDLINYDRSIHQNNLEHLKQMIANIGGTPVGKFELTSNLKRCLYCNYRSLCNRGDKAGLIDQIEDEDSISPDQALDFDFDSVPEIQL